MTKLVVLDSGALERVETNRVLRGMLRRLLERGADVEVPTVVLVEAVTGRPPDAVVNRVVKRLGTMMTDEPTARRAGALRHRRRGERRRAPSAIDAVVAAHAVASGVEAVVFTTDVADLSALVEGHSAVRVERA